MQVIRHHDKVMQEVVPFGPIVKDLGGHNIRYFSDLEHRNVLGGFGGYKVGPSRVGAMCQMAHKIFPQGLKPLTALISMSELKPRPPKPGVELNSGIS